MDPSCSLKRKSITNYCEDVTEPNCKRTKYNVMEETIVHDVFVNFSEDTTNGFSSHLRGALRRHSFTVFDHTMLPSGHDVCSELLKAVKESGIYVVVFSVNYARSERCLDELVNIMRCFHNSEQRKVLPVFFNVEPSDVRKQVGSYEEAFAAHETYFDRERVQKWRQAMEDAGGLSGSHLQNGDEEKFIKKIVKQLENMQNPQELYVARHPVGIGSRVERLISDLRLDSEDVFIVAVWGIGGIGKTTIVKATYNRIAAKFEGRCFLADIQDHYGRPNWKVDLQNDLFSSLSQNYKYRVIHGHNEGVAKIKNLIRCRKVLLVLDGVDKFEQLQILGVDPTCFYRGSRIIITTRDKSSLGILPYTSYNTSLLSYKESLKLFTRLTFEQALPVDQELVYEIVSCAAGLPLVVEVWSVVFRNLEREHWPSQLKTLIRIPHDDVQRKLKTGYDSLDHGQKKLFLDIACFFDGRDTINGIVQILKDEESAFFPDLQIRKLVDKCLVELPYGYIVSMHQAIRDMAREIVREENEDEPGKRSRLWDRMDVMHVLRESSGTSKIQSIRLVEEDEDEELQVEALRNMSNLRLIFIADEFYNLSWTCSNDNMPPLSFKKLKYLRWDKFPLKFINIDMPNVVEVRLRGAKLERLWEGIKSFKKLKILDVSHSRSLTKTANFSEAKNLEKLNFEECENLEELHSSVGCLDKLVILNLQNCSKLLSFPTEVIGKLRSLQELDLTNCNSIGLDEDFDPLWYSLKECRITKLFLSNCNISKIPDEIGSLTWLEHLDISKNRFPSLPNGLGKLHQLKTMYLSYCGRLQSIAKLSPNITDIQACDCVSLTSLPSSMSELKSLEKIHLDNCSKLGYKDPECLLKFIGLTNLISLRMSNCNVSQVPNEIGNLVSLYDLGLSGNTFTSLPDGLGRLHQLTGMDLSNCGSMHSIAKLPSNIRYFKARNCTSLTNLPSNMSELKSLEQLELKGCMKLGSGDPECLVKLIGLTNLHSLDMSNCNMSQVPIEMGNLVPLSDLDLSGNTFSSLPDSFSNLSSLTYLKINCCYKLRSLPLLPSAMSRIDARECVSLDVMPFASKQTVDTSLCLGSICSNNRSGSYEYELSRNVLQLYKKSSFISRLSINLSNNKDYEVPNWCSYRSRRDSLSFVAPPLLDKKIYGMILCAREIGHFAAAIRNETKKRTHGFGFISCDKDVLGVNFYPLNKTTLVVEAGDRVVLEYEQQNTEFGLRLIYDNDEAEHELSFVDVPNLIFYTH